MEYKITAEDNDTPERHCLCCLDQMSTSESNSREGIS